MEGTSPPKNLPKIRRMADLIAFCRKSKHELLKNFGVLIDPEATKGEVLALNFEMLESAARSYYDLFFRLLDGKADLLSVEEARGLLREDNALQVHLGVCHRELSISDLLYVIKKYGACSSSELGYHTADGAADILIDHDLSVKTLRRLGEIGGEIRESILLTHENTPPEMLQHIIATTRNAGHAEWARDNLRGFEDKVSSFPVSAPEEIRIPRDEENEERELILQLVADRLVSRGEELAKSQRSSLRIVEDLLPPSENKPADDEVRVKTALISDDPHLALKAAAAIYEYFVSTT
jgi:hypothetical protein